MRSLALAALAALVIDQVSKYAVIFGMDLIRLREIEVLPPLLNFRYGENRGINFGLFDGGTDTARWILIGVALAICAALLVWVRRSAPSLPVRISAGLLIGGALANVLDRLMHGYVLDFLNMSCCGIYNPFVFNLADVFIFLGAIGLAFLPPEAGARGARPRRNKDP